jgi:hypothetical protein
MQRSLFEATFDIRSIHEWVRFACEQCDYLATEKGSLKQYVRAVHEKLREYQCVLCHLLFSTRQPLINTFELCTQSSCFFCQVYDFNAENAQNHINILLIFDVTSKLCILESDIDVRTARANSHLSEHLRRVCARKPFQCDRCRKRGARLAGRP